ncbi:hypothetical protein ACROYT_G022448, partial [Oculina patagonica]
SNMAEAVQRLNFGQLLEELKNASEFGWDSFIHVCQQTREVIGDFLFKVETLNVDFYAQQIVPSKELEEYVPLTVTGDGSCLYRSISLLVNGDRIVAVRGKSYDEYFCFSLTQQQQR